MIMRDRERRIVGTLITAAVISLSGCGGGAPREDSSTEEATVSGKVSFKGKPLTTGDVTFSAGNVSRPSPPRKSPISKEGTYSVKTLVGVNNVEVFSATIQKAGPDMPPFSYTVKSGDQTLDIDLPKDKPAEP
jgi:hypothetical protein